MFNGFQQKQELGPNEIYVDSLLHTGYELKYLPTPGILVVYYEYQLDQFQIVTYKKDANNYWSEVDTVPPAANELIENWDVSEDGEAVTLVLGVKSSVGDDRIDFYTWNSGTEEWDSQQSISESSWVASNAVGYVPVSIDGDRASFMLNSASNKYLYTYVRSGGTWTEEDYLDVTSDGLPIYYTTEPYVSGSYILLSTGSAVRLYGVAGSPATISYINQTTSFKYATDFDYPYFVGLTSSALTKVGVGVISGSPLTLSQDVEFTSLTFRLSPQPVVHGTKVAFQYLSSGSFISPVGESILVYELTGSPPTWTQVKESAEFISNSTSQLHYLDFDPADDVTFGSAMLSNSYTYGKSDYA